MANSVPKLALSRSRDIPFDRLVLSQANVRRLKCGVSIGELADDIMRRTLLQSLNVRAVLDDDGKETGKFEVPAGGRRFRALELLVTSKRMAKNQPVPCVIREGGSAEEDSLVENTMRMPLHPLDQFRAFKALRDAGTSEDRRGNQRVALAVRSETDLFAQIDAPGVTWLDRRNLACDGHDLGGGFGREVKVAMEVRTEHLIENGSARRQGQRIVFARDLLATLERGDIEREVEKLARDVGLSNNQPLPAEYVTGTVRERITIASGRYAMIDDSLGFSLVPWPPSLDNQIGKHISGVMRDVAEHDTVAVEAINNRQPLELSVQRRVTLLCVCKKQCPSPAAVAQTLRSFAVTIPGN